MKYWLVATYKINKIKIVEANLLNQNFEYLLPKITTKKINSSPVLELLFPGYIFINTSFNNYSKVKFTKGIKDIIKFGSNFSYMTNKDINIIREMEELSKLEPIESNIKIGQKAIITKDSFKGSIVTISSLPKKERVNVLLNLLGSKRKISISVNDLAF